MGAAPLTPSWHAERTPGTEDIGSTRIGPQEWLDGYLYLTDRQAHMIISGGVNIYPQEAENVLAGHPAVVDVAVIGVPDVEMGESVKAIMQPVDPASAGPELKAELLAYCRARLATTSARAPWTSLTASQGAERQALQAAAAGALLGGAWFAGHLSRLRGRNPPMAWDFETDPEYQEKLDWANEFVREEVEPLDSCVPTSCSCRMDDDRAQDHRSA